ncbi:MAG: TonB-dependent receptor, partial [Blastocatellia bacterium]
KRVVLKPLKRSINIGPILMGLLFLSSGATAQIQIGTVKGSVADATGALLPRAVVTIDNSITGFHRATTVNPQGEFTFENVPFDSYVVRVAVSGFQVLAQSITLRSNIPVLLDLRLIPAGASESIKVGRHDELVEADSASTETGINRDLVSRMPDARDNGKLQRVIATTPGWTLENGGLLHIRGVDDGALYVVDGVPTSDRIDAVMASPFDTDSIQSVNVMTGNIPAEFGGKSGAVVTVQPRSGIGQALAGTFSIGAGSLGSRQISASAVGGIKEKLGFYISTDTSRTDRCLDPVDLGNFHNRGGPISFGTRSDYHPTSRDLILSTVTVSGTDFQEPNTAAQELAGQRQRQELRNDYESVMWQRTWSPNIVTNGSIYRRFYHAKLIGSEFDTPLAASQNREHSREGVLASITASYKGHTLKAGGQGERVTPREFFEFAVTDQKAAEDADISPQAALFTLKNPFVFSNRAVRGLGSAYIQDAVSPFRNLTINAGLRYDYSDLLVRDQQVSPRIGAVYFISKTGTVIRGSFNRLYMPPQVENILLANSQQARELSPFATGAGSGGSAVAPERVSAWEAGFAQDIAGLFRLDAAGWWRSFRNIDDPNVLFNTTIIFPNSVASATAHGVDVRLDMKERAGWSGYMSYANSRILETGPLNGGLFLTDDFADLGPGVKFIPDHDQRNEAAFGVTYSRQNHGLWASFSGTYQSGVPVDLGSDQLSQLQSQLQAQGLAKLVDFSRGRVKPWAVFNFAAGIDLFKTENVAVKAQFGMENIFDREFAFNFGNPFSGTHFGYPRLWSGRVQFEIHK